MDEPPLKVFISYRTKDHAELLPRIAKVLRAEGIEVAYDEILRDEHHRQIDGIIPISSGVNLRLFSELLYCHAVLVLIPDEPADPYAFVSRWQDWVDLVTQALADLSIRGGHGLPLELQAGALYDLPVIWVPDLLRHRHSKAGDGKLARVGGQSQRPDGPVAHRSPDSSR